MNASSRTAARSRYVAVIQATQLLERRVRLLTDRRHEDLHVDRAGPTAASRARSDRPSRPPARDPALERAVVDVKQRGEIRVRTFPTLVRLDRALTERHVVRIGHGAI